MLILSFSICASMSGSRLCCHKKMPLGFLACGSQAFIATLLFDPSVSALSEKLPSGFFVCGSQAFMATLLFVPSMSALSGNVTMGMFFLWQPRVHSAVAF